MCGWSEADLDKRCIQEGLFSIPGELEWFNGECYRYDRARVPDCKTDLTLSSNLTVLCDDQSASVDDDYVNNSALDVPTYVQPLRTEIVKQTICEVLNICDDQSVNVDDDYVNNSAWDGPTYVQPPRTEIVKQTICDLLNICD